jgi:signal transduction histidine kinase
MKRALFKILFLLIVWTHHSQCQVSENYLKSVYLVKIANNFNWESSSKPIKIGVLSEKKEFLATLQKYAQKQNIGERSLVVNYLQSNKKIQLYDIIYIGEENNSILSECKKEIKGSRTLIFTNNAPNNENSMINFYQDYDQRIKFKINLLLLREHQLEPSNSMLVSVGSDNDLLSRFNENDSSIVLERNVGLRLKAQNLHQKQLLNKTELRMDSIKSSLKIRNIEIKKINQELFKQKHRLKKISKKIHSTSQQLKEKELKIKTQEKLIGNQVSIFQKQKKDIESQDNILEKQENLLNLKEQYLNYAYIFSLAILGILLFAVITFLGKQKSNKKLAIQNEKLKKTLHTLQQTQAKLVQNEKMASLGMVTAGMAHEINNPMTFIYAGVNVLKSEINTLREIIKELSSSKPKEFNSISASKTAHLLLEYSGTQKSVDQTILDIEFGAKRVTDIVNSLQNFSRLNEDDVKTIDLKKAFESTLKILNNHAKQKKISISTHISSKELHIECFPASINQVFMNLISNAIDACPNQDGEISVKASIQKNIWVIKITDNGCGIENKNIGKIFDPFFTTKSIGKGTGLGLSISYNIIKKHNGNILVENNQKNGVCFTLEIPIKYNKTEYAK